MSLCVAVSCLPILPFTYLFLCGPAAPDDHVVSPPLAPGLQWQCHFLDKQRWLDNTRKESGYSTHLTILMRNPSPSFHRMMGSVTTGAERDEIEQRDLHSYSLPCLTVMLDFEYPESVIGGFRFRTILWLTAFTW
ncbi:uncharacterized protein P174DRAFT_428019 [Aspergillus novofumigatus IBT 16806]|uniref:Uncharacterized protein n=1 Tax=Aspergillus novofumigatus (strain IBT 16806) TaxID=1392255 RepID=A0A2I1CFT9_ASPN1|nr:uncharacterized protein P174DRAFT_428019 [Aspergillus novofumigatus IBT 16806]PKX96471.1 hypothetical protein P174DRAFT_428019 [Aspergillus novofumigatus IBT 16806]